jgi:hypothetical protein
MREACVRGNKHYIAQSKAAKKQVPKQPRLKRAIKLSSQDWYKRAAARMSIRRVDVESPSIVPE